MVVAAWIVFIGIVGLLVTHIILLIANKKYRKRIKKAWFVAAVVILTPFLLYAGGTSLLIMIQGDCFVAYYNPGGREMFYYNGYEYYLVDNDDEVKEIVQYGDWKATDLYISSRPIAFPYLEYWWPKIYTDELMLPGDLEPIYLGIVQWDGRMYYVREDVMDEL